MLVARFLLSQGFCLLQKLTQIKYSLFEEMYRPYSNQYYEQEEEPLVEEFDPNFQPDEEEVKMYAVEALGMDLPEDNRFLYLARQALKKPLPDTWGAYQRSDGEVYYKHKVTQEKTTEHPIDLEYRRLFQQEKDKAARRTLKSKANKPTGMAAMKLLGNIAREEELVGGGGNLLSNISGVSEQSNIDLERQLEAELAKYQRSLQRDLDEFKTREERQQNDKERRLKESHQEELDRITRNSMMPISFDERLKQEKNSIRKQLEEEKEDAFKSQLRDQEERIKRQTARTEKDLENQWQLKLRDIQERNSQKLQTKAQQIEKAIEEVEKEKEQRERKRKEEIERARLQFQRNKTDFDKEANKQLEIQIQNISKQTVEKTKQKKNELEGQYIKLRKLLKSSPEDRIKELIEKKTRLQEISNKKFQTYRAKQLQLIEKDSKMKFQKEKQKASNKFADQFQKVESQYTSQQDDKLSKYTDQLNKQNTGKLNAKQKEIFERFKQKLSNFQLTKNKSLIDARQKFIKQIEGKKNQMDKDNALNSIRLLIRQREFDITNHEKQIKNLKTQIKLHQRKLKKYDLDRKLYRLENEQQITDILKNQLGILKQKGQKGLSNKKDPLPAVFQQHELKLQELKKNLNYDHRILQKVLKHLQSTSILPFYQRRKIINSDLPTDFQAEKLQAIGAGKNELIKRYNVDVRRLRQNQKMISEYEQLIKKADYDEETALAQLRLFQIDYKVPDLRAELEAEGSDGGVLKLKQYIDKNPLQNYSVNPDLASTKRVQDIMEDHSRFLMNIKQELNSKLWEIRGMGYYSRRF